MLESVSVVLAYLLGSIPTALFVSRSIAGADIRQFGDGNMGARNVAHVLGWGPAIVVAGADVGKGAIAVLLARQLGTAWEWQLAAGVCVVIGHDFPVFAGFQGGQGFAAAVGSFLVLLPMETPIGLTLFGLTYLATRRYNPSAALGMAVLFTLAMANGRPTSLLGYVALLLLTVPAKKALDLPRRRRLDSARR
jgi:acyl phosphate:glycerol-3-phosphate acyltransferase